LSPRQFGKLITVLRREGADPVRRGRPWSLPLEDTDSGHPGDWSRIERTFRDGHTATWWAAEARLG
jgi:hypothetical protein